MSVVEAVGPAIARLTETTVSVLVPRENKSKMRRVRPPRFFTGGGGAKGERIPHYNQDLLRMYNVGTSAGEEGKDIAVIIVCTCVLLS